MSGAPADLQGFLKTGGLSAVYVADSPLSRLAADVYALLTPYAEVDEANGYALRSTVEALTKMYFDVDELVREGVNGEPGWSAAVDATRVPSEGLAWLGQIFGVRINPGESVSYYRQRVDGAVGIRRGSMGAMTLAVQPYLTGGKLVVFGERNGGSAYSLVVKTRTAETPNTAPVIAALQATKPAGVLLGYSTFTGILFQESKVNQATYTLSKAAKATYTLRGA
jgi:hypothetical protein